METYNVLCEEERSRLRDVPLTLEEAQQIIDRCAPALALVEAGKKGIVLIGCPHCTWTVKKGINCTFCKYPGYAEFRCLTYSFGGQNHSSIGGIVILEATRLRVCEGSEEGRDRASTWLKGHIEWGQRTLNGTL